MRSPYSAAMSSSIGPSTLQGPHHSAQNSTITGTSDPATSSSNVCSVRAVVPAIDSPCFDPGRPYGPYPGTESSVRAVGMSQPDARFGTAAEAGLVDAHEAPGVRRGDVDSADVDPDRHEEHGRQIRAAEGHVARQLDTGSDR